jgi:alpha-mannosidase
METLAALVTGRRPEVGGQKSEVGEYQPETLATGIFEESSTETDAAKADSLQSATDRFASALTAANPIAAKGTLVINPSSFIRRMGVEAAGLGGLPTIERPVYAADESAGRTQAVVDVPAFGFAHLAPGKPAGRDKKSLLLVEDGVLRNEFFEAIINPTTGSMAAIHEKKTRGNRLSQQLALRLPGPKQKPGDTYRDPDESAVYSVMAADSVETTVATRALGEIVTRGRLLDQTGKQLAAFRQTYRLWRGSRVLSVEVELDPQEEPRMDPWNSYYCVRLAWSDESAELFRTQHLTRQPAPEKKFESPHYVDIVSEKHNTTILTGGLAFHRRHEDRMLDMLLATRGERQRKFRFGIGVDLAHPLHEAIGILTPPVVVPNVPAPTSGNSGWLLHLSSRNVVATSLTPLEEDGKIAGFRLRLLETAARPANLAVSAFKPVKSAATLDFLGNTLADCAIEDGKIKLDLAACEWVEVVARW